MNSLSHVLCGYLAVAYTKVRGCVRISPDMCKKRLGSLPFILPSPSQQTQCLQDTRDPRMLLTGTNTLDMWRGLQTPANLTLVSHKKY